MHSNLTRRLFDENRKPDEYRSEYFRDHARIVHSAAYRRLQGKTQVIGLGESDFYRTRLTHSMEVASLSQSISSYIRKNHRGLFSDDEFEQIFCSDYHYLLSAIGFAHDIGHPPFGHSGERALHEKMYNHGGFEGNAQTLRILNQLAEYKNKYGVNPTARLILGVLKYPIAFEDAIKGHEYSTKAQKCIYKDDETLVKKLLNKAHFNDESIAYLFEQKKEKNGNESIYKSFDCAIMELADDLSNGIHDLEDAVALGMLKPKDFNDFKAKFVSYPEELNDDFNPLFSEFKLTTDDKNKDKLAEEFVKKFIDGNKYDRKECVNFLIKITIKQIKLDVRNNDQLDVLLKFTPTLKNWGKEFNKSCKDIIRHSIIKSEEVQHLEYKGKNIVTALFDVLSNNLELLQSNHLKRIEKNDITKERLICDYISGMTDAYALKLYKRLYTPDSGSVFDRL